jgi:hypothetical protein
MLGEDKNPLGQRTQYEKSLIIEIRVPCESITVDDGARGIF